PLPDILGIPVLATDTRDSKQVIHGTGTSNDDSAPSLGAVSNVDVRHIWPNEARDFTPWLAANLQQLGAVLGMELELVGVEVPVGPFVVDMQARAVSSGRLVIIENQLTTTDHSHAGQLLTYAAGLGASIVIWISPTFRDDHRQAIDWLNASTAEGVDF